MHREDKKMEHRPKILISVLVAAYNIQDLIERCLQSLINQTLKISRSFW